MRVYQRRDKIRLKLILRGKRLGLTRTHMALLDESGRVRELARMLGGIHLSEQTLAHAREMLGAADSRH